MKAKKIGLSSNKRILGFRGKEFSLTVPGYNFISKNKYFLRFQEHFTSLFDSIKNLAPNNTAF